MSTKKRSWVPESWLHRWLIFVLVSVALSLIQIYVIPLRYLFSYHLSPFEPLSLEPVKVQRNIKLSLQMSEVSGERTTFTIYSALFLVMYVGDINVAGNTVVHRLPPKWLCRVQWGQTYLLCCSDDGETGTWSMAQLVIKSEICFLFREFTLYTTLEVSCFFLFLPFCRYSLLFSPAFFPIIQNNIVFMILTDSSFHLHQGEKIFTVLPLVSLLLFWEVPSFHCQILKTSNMAASSTAVLLSKILNVWVNYIVCAFSAGKVTYKCCPKHLTSHLIIHR